MLYPGAVDLGPSQRDDGPGCQQTLFVPPLPGSCLFFKLLDLCVFISFLYFVTFVMFYLYWYPGCVFFIYIIWYSVESVCLGYQFLVRLLIVMFVPSCLLLRCLGEDGLA